MPAMQRLITSLAMKQALDRVRRDNYLPRLRSLNSEHILARTIIIRLNQGQGGATSEGLSQTLKTRIQSAHIDGIDSMVLLHGRGIRGGLALEAALLEILAEQQVVCLGYPGPVHEELLRDRRFHLAAERSCKDCQIGRVAASSFINQVIIDGVVIREGDYLYTDNTGTVVIPEHELERVIEHVIEAE